VQHGGAARRQRRAQLAEPDLLQRRQQLGGDGAFQHPRHPSHVDRDPLAGGLGQQASQLGIGQGHVGAHQHQNRQGTARGITAA